MKKLIAFLLLLLMPLTALANDYFVDARKDIEASYPEGCRVTIVDFGTDTCWIDSPPRWFWSYSDVQMTADAPLALLEEFQFATHATGATERLIEAYTTEFPVTLTGHDTAHLDGLLGAGVPRLNNTLTMEIPAGFTITGPEEGAPYNSRLYFARIYGERGTLTASAQRWLSAANEEITAEYAKPLIWVLYAVDVYVEPLGGTP